jgi:hypothetical protein
VANGDLTQINDPYNFSLEYKHEFFTASKEKTAQKHETPATKKKAAPEKKTWPKDCT